MAFGFDIPSPGDAWNWTKRKITEALPHPGMSGGGTIYQAPPPQNSIYDPNPFRDPKGFVDNTITAPLQAPPVQPPKPPGDPYSFDQYWFAGRDAAYRAFDPQQQIINQQLERDRRNAGLDGAFSPFLADFTVRQRQMEANAGLDRRALGVQREGIGVDYAGIDRNNAYVADSAAADTGKVNRESAYDRFKRTDAARAGGATGSAGYREDLSQSRANQGYVVDKIGRDSKEAIAANNQRKATLDLKAKQLGIDSDRLESELKYGIERLGLSRLMTTEKLLDQLNSTNMQDAMLAQKILDNAIQMTGLYQQSQYLPPGTQAAMDARAQFKKFARW